MSLVIFFVVALDRRLDAAWFLRLLLRDNPSLGLARSAACFGQLWRRRRFQSWPLRYFLNGSCEIARDGRAYRFGFGRKGLVV